MKNAKKITAWVLASTLLVGGAPAFAQYGGGSSDSSTTMNVATGTTSATSSSATEVPLVFSATLSGREETPLVPSATTGAYTMSFNTQKTEVSFALSVWNGEDITMAHLHCGARGVAGPVVATLMTTTETSGQDVHGVLAAGVLRDTSVVGQGAATTSCAYNTRNLNDLFAQANAGNIYVNVHSAQYPSGVIRGQLIHGATTTTTTPSVTTPTTTAPVVIDRATLEALINSIQALINSLSSLLQSLVIRP